MPIRLGPRLSQKGAIKPILAILATGLMWSSFSIFLSQAKTNIFVLACILCGTTASFQFLFSWIAGQRPKAAIQIAGIRRIIILTLVDLGLLIGMYLAVQNAPVGPVIAISLTAPIILTGAKLVQNPTQHPVTKKRILSILAVAGGLIIMGFAPEGKSQQAHVLFGLLCSLGVALLIASSAGFFRRITLSGAPSFATVGFVNLCLMTLNLPALFMKGAPPLNQVIMAMMAGMMAAISAALFWFANQHLLPITIQNFRLLEPFMGSLGAYCFLGAKMSLFYSLAMLPILIGIYLDLNEQRFLGRSTK